MASVAMETRVGDVTELSRNASSPPPDFHYRPVEAGKISGLHVSEIEAVAERLAKELDFEPGDDLVNVVRKLGGELRVFSPSIDQSRFSGTLVSDQSGSFQILVPARSSMSLDKIVIAKELGHYFLHHLYSRAVLAQPEGDKEDDMDPIALSNAEAELFALCFLMPKSRFRRDVNRVGNDTPALATRYGIPVAFVEKRKKLLDNGRKRR